MPTMQFNHMELTFPKGTFTPEFRADMKRFYGDVFGWKVIDFDFHGMDTIVLRPDKIQFLLLVESEQHLASPGMDHLGLLVESRAVVDDMLEECRRFAEKDDRCEVLDFGGRDSVTPRQTTHAFYVRYLTPIYFDIQCNEFAEGREPAHHWVYQ
jgi:hypothetical protein